MSSNREFGFLESVYMPVVICTKKGRIVSRNRYADVIDNLPGNGLSIEAAAEPEEAGTSGIRFRRLRQNAGAFRTALLFPVFSASGTEYVGWLFDVAFQLADTSRLQTLLDAYRGFSLSAQTGANADSDISNRAVFRRFCQSVYPALLSTVSGHRISDVHYACRTLLYSLRQILDRFGCRTELSLPDSFIPGAGVDYSSLVLSMIYLLIFVMSESDAGRLKASVFLDGGRISAELEVPFDGKTVKRGGFAELEEAFPNSAVMTDIISASFAERESDFSFDCANGRLCVRFSQKTFEYKAHNLRQHTANTDIRALLVFAAMMFAQTKRRE